MENRIPAYNTFLHGLRDSEVDALKANPVLVISGNEECGNRVAHAIRKRGLEVVFCSRLRDAQVLLTRRGFSLVFASHLLPDGDLREVIRTAGATPVIAFSRAADWDAYLYATRHGAIDCMACPSSFAEPEGISRYARHESDEASENMLKRPAQWTAGMGEPWTSGL
jgi:DNA-binding NtrC family response regulator